MGCEETSGKVALDGIIFLVFNGCSLLYDLDGGLVDNDEVKSIFLYIKYLGTWRGTWLAGLLGMPIIEMSE